MTIPVIEPWLAFAAGRLGVRTAARKDAPRRQASRARGLTNERQRAAAGIWLQPRHRFEQGLRIGVARRREDFFGRRQFDDPAQIHDRDAIAEPLHDRQIMRNEQTGQAEPLAQLQ
jgi:hypothetical protein